MAKRNPNYEYVDKVNAKGEVTHTLIVKLYAPDGSIFLMPHGGDPANYIAKGYKLKPDADWRALNETYEKEKARSLKVSNFQREIKEREVALQREKEALEANQKMKEMEEQMAKAEAELSEAINEFNSEPNPVLEEEPAPENKAPAKKKASKK